MARREVRPPAGWEDPTAPITLTAMALVPRCPGY